MTSVTSSLDGLHQAVREQLGEQVIALLHHGSTALGFGNAGSDLDLLALCAAAPSRSMRVVRLGEAALHVELRLPAELTTDRLERVLQSRMLDVNTLESRIASSRIVWDPQGVAERLVAKFAAWGPPPTLLEKMALEVLGFLADARGALADGDDITADVAVRLGGHVLAKVWLLAAGEQYIALKWQHQQLLRVAPELAPTYRRLVVGEGTTLPDRVRLLADAFRSTGARMRGAA